MSVGSALHKFCKGSIILVPKSSPCPGCHSLPRVHHDVDTVMLNETFLAATEAVNKPSAHLSSALKDVGIFHYEFQPQNSIQHGYKKTSVRPNCLAISDSHLFAAQVNKAVIHVYSRDKGNQEATIAFPDRISSLAYASEAAILVIGTDDGKLVLWETATGRVTTSAASHLDKVLLLAITTNNEWIVSGSADSNIHIWSLPRLIEFNASPQSYGDASATDVPTRTFTHHRGAITALALGHSRTATNFAVSASIEGTCYVWHLATCQILRTILVPATTLAIALDPADRAIYLGNNDGTVQNIDVFGNSTTKSKRSIYDATDSMPMQLSTEDSWAASSSDPGAINCLTLSYDGTTLLSGHIGGSIIRWDIAKHRVVSEIANLHQSVSCIEMLVPDGLQRKEQGYSVPTVIKPRLGLNAESTESTIGLPASYSLTAKVTKGIPASGLSKDIGAALAGSLFSDAMLDEALQAMIAQSAGVTSSAVSASATSNKDDTYRIQALEEDKARLENNIVLLQKIHNQAQERHRQRSERREQIGQQRREAYFAAKKKGKDGDEAMKPFEKKLEAIDVESDHEALEATDGMDVDG